jgi:hypothetical protein
MAVDQDLLDDIAASIADLYRSVEIALVKTVAARLRQDPPLPSPFQEGKLSAVGKLRASAVAILNTLQGSKAGAIRNAISRAYRTGTAAAQTDLPDLTHAGNRRLPRTQLGPAARQALETVPGAAVIENIAGALHRDLGRVEGNLLRNVLDGYRQVQAATAARIATGTETRREASQAAWQALMDKGLTSFTDTRGRQWRLSSYAEMVGRTNVARAATQGQTDRLTSLGVNLVYVSNHSQECKLCRPYEGKILSINGPTGDIKVEHATRDGVMVTVHVVATLDQARAAGFQHPNCRHSVSAYTPGITRIPKATADPEGDQARQRQRALERDIRKYKERAEGALTPEAKKAANAKVRERQAALRDHLAANPKLKRLPYQEQIGAGNIPRAGGPAGGPAQDLGPTVQPTLDGGPASQARTPEPAEPTVPQAARKFHRALDPDTAALARRVEDGLPPRDSVRLGGMSAETELVTLKDGSKAIRKKARTGLADMQDAAAEHVSSLVARALGLRAPAVYRRDAGEIWMEYVDGELGGGFDRNPRFTGMPNSDQGKVLGLIDSLIHNVDRNDGNWMVHDGALVPIDHGASYGEWITPDRQPSLEYIHSDFADHYKDGPNPLTAEDVAEVRRRLEALRADFAHVDREHWITYSLKVLDQLIAPNAAGTRNLIAGVR